MGRIALLLVVAMAMPLSAPGAESKDVWQEELLQQLFELRKSQGELKAEVATLRSEVAALRTGVRGDPLSLDLRNPLYPSLGDAKAQVAVVEFSDFQCPYCRKHEQSTMPMLREQYVNSGKVRYFFLDFPLTFHPHALEAAIAGACAQRQNAFWQMHDRLFENQNQLGPDLYLKLSDEAGLDKPKFQACLADAKVKREVAERVALGERAGVQGTPAFLIGRLTDGVLTDTRAVSGARSFEDFQKVLDQYLRGS